MFKSPTSIALVVVVGVAVAACTPDRQPSPAPAADPTAPAAPSPATTVASASATSIDPRLLSLNSLYAASASDPASAARLYTEDATKRFGEMTELHRRTAIEASVKDEIAKLGKPTYAASRVWIKGDTLIADEVTRASVGGRTIGVPQLGIYWFDASGLIKTHHTYRNETDLDAQVAGRPDAPHPSPLPESIETHVARDSSDEAAGAALMGRYDAAFTKGPEAIAPLVADDVAFACTLGAHAQGKAEFLDQVGQFMTHFPDQTYTIEHVWSVDDFIVVEHAIRATRKMTGKPIRMPCGEVFRVSNGKIAGDWAYIDVRSFAKPVL